MSSKPLFFKMLAVVMAVTILSGCATNTAQSVPTATSTATLVTLPTTVPSTVPTTAPTVAAPTGTLAPTVDQNLVNTQAAQTAAANMTLNAPTAAPTNTLTAAATATSPAASTVTPRPTTGLPTATFIPWTLTPSATSTGYACAVTSTSPKSSETVKVSTDFTWSWVIQNTGIKLWGQHNADLKYVSGTAMQTGASIYNLTSDVAHGASYTASIAMKSPDTAGTYTAAWQIVQDSVLVCSLTVSVRVTY